MLRGNAAARGADDDAVDLHAGHALGGVDGEADGGLGLLHVDDLAGLHAARALVADAENAAAVRAAARGLAGFDRIEPRNKADDLARTDIQHGQNGALARRQRTHTRQIH